METTLKLLNRAYIKRLKQLNKDILAVAISDSGLSVFVECLKYLRDYYIVTKKSSEIVSTIDAAVEEFYAYNSTKKDFHWNNFCELIRLNMKEWLVANDTV